MKSLVVGGGELKFRFCKSVEIVHCVVLYLVFGAYICKEGVTPYVGVLTGWGGREAMKRNGVIRRLLILMPHLVLLSAVIDSFPSS